MRKLDLSRIKTTESVSSDVLSFFSNALYNANSTVSGVVKLVDSTSNTSATIAASANSVKVAYDLAVAAGANATSAYSNAVSVAATDASNKAATAYANAYYWANSLSSTAYSNAVSVASSDATSKAATSYANGVTYTNSLAATAYSNAVTQATSLAATAYSNAIAVSATAYSNAIAYAASNTYVNNTFAPLASPTITGLLTANNVNITGNLTVSGTTTYINTSQLNIGDNILTLNADHSGTPTENAGFEVNRGSSANVSLLWNESSSYFSASANLNTVGTLSANVLSVSNVSVTQQNLQVDAAGTATAMAIVFGG